MSKLGWAVIAVLFLYGCGDKPEYFTTPGGLDYKLLDFTGEGIKPTIGQHLSLYTCYLDDSDSLFYSSTQFKANHFEYHHLLPPEKGTFQELLAELQIGDSAVVRLRTKDFFRDYLKGNVPEFLTGDSLMTVHVRLVNAQDYSDFQLSKDAEKDWMEMKELAIIKDHLDSTELNYVDAGGVFVALIDSDTTNLNKIKFGDIIRLSYQARFLETNNLFYSTYRNMEPDEFSYGRSGQLIRGLEVALSGRQYGDSIQIIIPSTMAFGDQGSAGGIVPAYTALKYNIRIE